MGVHTITHFLGGTIAVEADFIVGRNGDLELSDARIGTEPIDLIDSVGELVNGQWKTLAQILSAEAEQKVEDWLDEDRFRDSELMRAD